LLSINKGQPAITRWFWRIASPIFAKRTLPAGIGFARSRSKSISSRSGLQMRGPLLPIDRPARCHQPLPADTCHWIYPGDRVETQRPLEELPPHPADERSRHSSDHPLQLLHPLLYLRLDLRQLGQDLLRRLVLHLLVDHFLVAVEAQVVAWAAMSGLGTQKLWLVRGRLRSLLSRFCQRARTSGRLFLSCSSFASDALARGRVCRRIKAACACRQGSSRRLPRRRTRRDPCRRNWSW